METHDDRPRNLRTQPVTPASEITAWKIAAGVFLGLSMFYVVYRVHVAMEQRAAIAEFNRMMTEPAQPRAVNAPRPTKIERDRQVLLLREELAREGYRCVSGQLFKRVENGWTQTGACPKLSNE